MKKKNMIIIGIIAILVIAIVIFFVINNINQSNINVEIEEVKQYNYFVLKQNDKYGIIDTKGNILINPEYEEVKLPNPEKAIFVCYQGEKTRVFNEKVEEILTQYENVEPIQLKNIASNLIYEKSVLKYEQNGKYGLINFEGKKLVDAVYDEIDSLPYKEGELIVKQNEKCGLININGKKIIKTEYDEINSDQYYTNEENYNHSGYIVSNKTQEGYRYGYIDYKAKLILPVEYNEINKVSEEYLICAKNGQYGVNKNQENIIKNEYQSIRYDQNNKAFIVEKSGKFGAINTEGKSIIPVEYNQIDITGIYLYAQNEQGTTVYDNNGTQVKVEPSIAILNTSNDKYKIKINNDNGTKYGIIDKNGKQIIEEKYSYIEYLHDNFFIVSDENGKLGVIDDNENIKVEINNSSLQRIQDTDLIQTTLIENEETLIYDKQMNEICKLTNAMVETINNYIKVSNEQEIKYFDKNGKEVDALQVYPNSKLLVEIENNKYGFKDRQGNIAVECTFDKAYEFNEYGFAAVQKDGKWGVVDENGKIVQEPIYELNDAQEKPEFIAKFDK